MSWIPKDRIVVPVDFSDASFAAVDEALEIVPDASHLHVVHVLPHLSANDPAVRWNVIDEDAAAEHVKATIEERLKGPRYAGHHVVVMFGNPGAEIAAYAEKIDADLIVLPSHGRTGLRRLLIGSVAERVVRLAHCPVLVLRDGFHDDEEEAP
jgi:nucleotide-binding universal stress UspA family protein